MKNIAAIILLTLLMFASACDNDADGDGISDEKDKCANTPAGTQIDSVGCPVKQKINKVTLYLDDSGSMQGYMFNGSKFQQNISGLASKIGVIKYNGLIDTVTPDVKTFVNAFSAANINGGSSVLHETLDKITTNLTDNSITLFVTDGVLSFSAKDIKANPKKNINDLTNMQVSIALTFSRLFAKGYACYVLASNSDFSGAHYWNYQNKKDRPNIALNNRPYYLFIIGKDKDIDLFVNEVIEKSGYNFDNSLLVNSNPLKTLVTVDRNLYNKKLKTGNWEYLPTETKIIIHDATKSVTFPILLNLHKFAPTDSTSLANAITVPNASKVTVYTKAAFVKDFYANGGLPKEYGEATHVVLAEFATPPQNMCTVEYSNPTWYKDWNVEDDRNPIDIEGKTFGIQYLMTGIINASNNTTKLASITIIN